MDITTFALVSIVIGSGVLATIEYIMYKYLKKYKEIKRD